MVLCGKEDGVGEAVTLKHDVRMHIDGQMDMNLYEQTSYTSSFCTNEFSNQDLKLEGWLKTELDHGYEQMVLMIELQEKHWSKPFVQLVEKETLADYCWIVAIGKIVLN
jgi:regulation of enolase protein 1 (concanavalin A-like superfamily)